MAKHIDVEKITSEILKYALAQKNGFQYLRGEHYGLNNMSYDGKGCCGSYVEYINKTVKGKICYHNINVELCFKDHGYSVHDHEYILHSDKILDPTFRQLFINTTGPKIFLNEKKRL
jgi:hypothetical protein